MTSCVGTGEKIGVAFQLADDVLDLGSDAATSGKTPGIDLREKVPTMPTLLVRRRASEAPDARTLEIVARLDGDLSSDEELSALVELLRDDPSLEETRALAQRTATRLWRSSRSSLREPSAIPSSPSRARSSNEDADPLVCASPDISARPDIFARS